MWIKESKVTRLWCVQCGNKMVVGFGGRVGYAWEYWNYVKMRFVFGTVFDLSYCCVYDKIINVYDKIVELSNIYL